jgi:hypothetical protein
MITPGDFIAHDSFVYTADGIQVCVTGGRFSPNINKRLNESEANARLFAASKDLLAVSEALVDGQTPIKAVVEMAFAALKKANVSNVLPMREGTESVGA